MLHKMQQRYPDALIYCMGMTARRDPDKADNYADVGQPTAFNAELKKIVERFGVTYVDLENCGIDADAETFDRYIGDARVHPNAAGMDKMTQALIDAQLGKKNASCTVTYNLANAVSDDAGGILLSGGAYTASLQAATGFGELTITVTMGGEDITASAVSGNTVRIDAVTADVVITACASVDDTPDNYYWEVDGNSLVNVVSEEKGLSSNSATKKAGTVADGVVNSAYFQLEKPVVLRHDRPWVVQWRAGGANWSGMLFSANATSNAADNSYLFKTTQNTGFIGFGMPVSGSYHNYGVALAAQGVDTVAEHTYRVENRITADGSNMAYLLVDGVDYGSMNHFFIGGNSDQGKQVDWVNGRDFCFSHIGSSGHLLKNCKLDYIAV